MQVRLFSYWKAEPLTPGSPYTSLYSAYILILQSSELAASFLLKHDLRQIFQTSYSKHYFESSNLATQLYRIYQSPCHFWLDRFSKSPQASTARWMPAKKTKTSGMAGHSNSLVLLRQQTQARTSWSCTPSTMPASWSIPNKHKSSASVRTVVQRFHMIAMSSIPARSFFKEMGRFYRPDSDSAWDISNERVEDTWIGLLRVILWETKAM